MFKAQYQGSVLLDLSPCSKITSRQLWKKSEKKQKLGWSHILGQTEKAPNGTTLRGHHGTCYLNIINPLLQITRYATCQE
jgi:hypothetical protein